MQWLLESDYLAHKQHWISTTVGPCRNMATRTWWSVLYSCSPLRVSRKLWTVYETVSCMQQLCKRYALRTCYYARASLWRQRQGLNYTQSQPTVSSTLMHRFELLLTRRGEQEYSRQLQGHWWTEIRYPITHHHCVGIKVTQIHGFCSLPLVPLVDERTVTALSQHSDYTRKLAVHQ